MHKLKQNLTKYMFRNQLKVGFSSTKVRWLPKKQFVRKLEEYWEKRVIIYDLIMKDVIFVWISINYPGIHLLSFIVSLGHIRINLRQMNNI